jgi:hypothetical protein
LSFTALPVFIIGLFGKTSLTAYGLSYSGSSLNFTAIWVTVLCSLAGLTAVGILWGKNWAIDLAIPYAYLAIITCVVAFALSLGSGGFTIPFEPIFLGFFIKVLNEKSEAWVSFDPNQKQEISNQQVDPTVKTPVESGNAQGTAGHP